MCWDDRGKCHGCQFSHFWTLCITFGQSVLPLCHHHTHTHTHFYQLVVNFHVGNTFCPYKQITFTNFLMDIVSSATVAVHQLIPGMISNDSCAICCTLPLQYALSPTTKLTEHRTYRLRNVTCWTWLITHNAETGCVWCPNFVTEYYEDLISILPSKLALTMRQEAC